MMQPVALTVRGETLRGVLHWPQAATECVPAAVLLHGFASRTDCRFLQAMAELLQSLGYATLQMDFSGHGRSSGDMHGVTVPRQADEARAMLRYVRGLQGVGPVLVLGHSQGGTVAVLLAGDDPGAADGLVLLSPAGHISEGCRRGVLQDARFDPKNIPDTVTMFGYAMSGDYFREGQQLAEYEHAARYPGPVCLLHAEADDVVPPVCAERYRQAFANCQLHWLPGGEHRYRDTLPQALEIVRSFAQALAKQQVNEQRP